MNAKKGNKTESPAEVVAIASKGEVFQTHPNGVILKLALGSKMAGRLQKALANERALIQLGLNAELNTNGLYAGFLAVGLTLHENTFSKKKARLEARPSAVKRGSGMSADRLLRRIEDLEGYVGKLEKVAATLEAGDAEPQKRLTNESIKHHSERIDFLKRQITVHERWVVRLQDVAGSLQSGDMDPAKKFAAESLEKNRKFLEELRSELRVKASKV